MRNFSSKPSKFKSQPSYEDQCKKAGKASGAEEHILSGIRTVSTPTAHLGKDPSEKEALILIPS